MELNNEERVRYSRTLMLSEIGESGQKKLLSSSVMIVGAGALGSICAMYLAASGIGRIGIADFDIVGLSNLQRQLSYSEKDLGKSKVDVLADRILSINSGIEVDVYDKMLTQSNVKEILAGYDIVIEGSDNPATKYMVADAAHDLDKPCIVGGVRDFIGQIMVFQPNGSSYREVFPDAPCSGGYTPCSVGGVLGPLPGVIASLQASEVIKIITGINSGKGSFFQIDLRDMHVSRFDID